MKQSQIATFGAGCFWHVQHEFDRLNGVIATEVGYAGGKKASVTYEEVCAGGTGHTEVCRVEYDPDVITYDQLLTAFFHMHDATQVNRQGPDVGYQYRSVIFTHDEAQKQAAERAIQTLEEQGMRIATAVEPATTYCPAEDYHQKYFEKTGRRVCAV